MKRRIVPVFLLVALTACGTDPNAARTAGAGSESASPTLSASSPTASDSRSTTEVTRPSATASATKTTSTGLAEGTVVMLPGEGVTFSSASQVNSTPWMTAEAKTFMVSELKRVQSGPGTCATLTVTGYRVSDLMNGSEFDCPEGGLILWGKTSSGWKRIVAGQAMPMCSEIRTTGWKTTIPHDFFGGQCMEGTGAIDYKP